MQRHVLVGVVCAVVLSVVSLRATPHVIHTSDNRAAIQAVLDGLACGDTVDFDPGTYDISGAPGLTINVRGCSGPDYITLRTANCPIGERRANISDLSNLAILDTSNTGATNLRITTGTHWVKLDCLAFRVSGGYSYNIIEIGSSTNTDPAVTPDHIYLDRIICTAGDGIIARRCVLPDAKNFTLTRSYCEQIKDSADAQCVASSNSFGPHTITDDYLEATGENILFGGSQPYATGAIADTVLIENDDITKRLEWRGDPRYTVKNLIEIKSGTHVVIRGNRLSHSWTNGQIGQALVLTPRTSTTDPAYGWSKVWDVLFERNTVSDVCAGIQMTGRPTGEAGEVVSTGSGHYTIQDSLWQINPSTGFCAGSTGKFLQEGYQTNGVIVRRNTVMGSAGASISYGNPRVFGTPVGFEVTGNRFDGGGGLFIVDYDGASGTGGAWGTVDLNTEFGSGHWTVTGNCWSGFTRFGWTLEGVKVTFPAGNTYSETAAGCTGVGVDASQVGAITILPVAPNRVRVGP